MLIENRKSYGEYIKEIQEMKGFKLHQDIDLLNITLKIFYGNYLQLNYLLDVYENDEEIFYVQNAQKLDELCMEIIRAFHNYSSSVSSRVDHMRRFKNNLNNKRANNFYKTEVEKLNNFDIVHFMKNLRNYIQHRALPYIKARYSTKLIEENLYEDNNKFLMDQNILLTWPKWDPNSKKYINSFKDGIELKLCCKEYHEIIVKFDRNFLEMINEEYEKDFKELDDFVAYVNKLYPWPKNL